MLDPLLVVVPARETTAGARSLSDDVPRLKATPLREILETAYPTDAHVALYTLPGDSAWPRLNKEILPEITAAGGRVEVSVTSLDWDTAGHRVLKAGQFDSFYSDILKAGLPQPTACYPTKNGARLIYAHQPLEPHDAEALHQSMVAFFASKGFMLDTKVWSWNTLHRLPRVVRDGQTQSPEILWGPDLDASSVPRTVNVRPLCAKTLDLPQPPESTRELVWVSGTRAKLSEWGQAAKIKLAGRLEGDLATLFDPHPLPLPEPRNTTIMRWMGCAAAIMSHEPTTTPEHLYGLFLGAVHASSRQDGRDLPAELWKIVRYCWAREIAKRETEQANKQTLLESLTAAILKWPTPPNLPHDHVAWLTKHLIVSVGRYYFVLQADGQYGRVALSKDTLFAGVRDSGLDGPGGLISLRDEEGNDVGEATLLRRYSTSLETPIELVAGPGRAWVSDNKLYMSAYKRKENLPPQYHKEVEEWLRRLGGERYNDLCLWIAFALAVEAGPVCALSLVGPAGSGKNLLVDGLAECFNTECVATKRDFGAYQYGLAESPILHVDEGWPSGMRDIPDTFRELVAGKIININKKFEPSQRIRSAPRIILTANNQSLIEELCSNKQMDAADQKALRDRLLSINVGPEASAHLAKLGGRAHTQGWVSGIRSPSRYVLAEHFLWLYEKHAKGVTPDMIVGSGRFLFEGKADVDEIWHLSSKADGVDEVGQALLKTHWLRDGGDAWVRIPDVQDQYHCKFDRWLPLNKISRLMKPFLLATNKTKVKVDGEWIRAKPLNVAKLEEFAAEHGLATAKVEAEV